MSLRSKPPESMDREWHGPAPESRGSARKPASPPFFLVAPAANRDRLVA